MKSGKQKFFILFIVWASLQILVLISLDAVPFLRGPSEGQWRWPYQPKPARFLGMAMGCGAGLLALLWLSGRRFFLERERMASRLMVLGAVLLGFCFQFGFLARDRSSPSATLVRRIADPQFTSYFTVAVLPVAKEPRQFLADHADWLSPMDVDLIHAMTHPVGGILYFRGAIEVCETLPRMSHALAEHVKRGGFSTAEFRFPLTEPGIAAALLGGMVLMLLSALSAWPVAILAERLGASPLWSARAAVLWPLVPSAALMTPEFDLALALPILLITVNLGAVGARGGGFLSALPTTAVRILLAGVCAGAAIQVSYGSAAFLGICFFCALAFVKSGRLAGFVVACCLVAAIGLGAAAFPMLFGHKPWIAFQHALENHRALTFNRGFLTWWIFNPLDFVIFLGLALSILWLLSSYRAIRDAIRIRSIRSLAAADRFRILFFAGIALLNLSASVRGEVGRIWAPLMPLALVAASLPSCSAPANGDRVPGANTAEISMDYWNALIIGGLLLINCFVLHLMWQVP